MLNTGVHPLSFCFLYRCCLRQCQWCSSQQTSVITVLVGVSYIYQNFRLIFHGGTSSTSSSMLISRKASYKYTSELQPVNLSQHTLLLMVSWDICVNWFWRSAKISLFWIYYQVARYQPRVRSKLSKSKHIADEVWGLNIAEDGKRCIAFPFIAFFPFLPSFLSFFCCSRYHKSSGHEFRILYVKT